VAIALIAAVQPAFAERIAGRVVGVADGDTLTVLAEGHRQVRVRLAGIDAPERRQPYGTRARQALSALAFGRSAQVEVEEIDRYERAVGRVRVGGRDVNAEMVRRGAAWVYTRYNRDPSLVPLEAEARAARRVLWALPEAERVPPWEWRAARRAGPGRPGSSARHHGPSALTPGRTSR
jgi:endonuclease YncB( thermonuclease family)